MIKEDFKLIKDSPYKIFKDGTVINNKTSKIVKHRKSWDYLYVGLSIKGKPKSIYLHKLLATYFIKNISDKSVVNHINGDKLDNRLSNLEWVTRSEDGRHAYKLELQDKKGEKHHFSRLKDKDIVEIRRLYRSGQKQYKIAKQFGVGQGNISRIVTKRGWPHIT